MKPVLDGTKETVHFNELPSTLLYINVEDEDYPFHWHAPLEIIMPLENNYTVECHKRTYVLRENDILVIPPGTLHHCLPGAGCRIVLQSNLNYYSSFSNFDSLISFFQPEFLITPEYCPEIIDECRLLVKTIADTYQSNIPFRELSVNSNLLKLLYIMGKFYMEQKSLQADYMQNKRLEYTDKFMQVCDYITEHSAENLTLEGVADLTGFSKYHFSRLFKDFTGTTFYKYLNTCRIANAENMLMDLSMNITDVATRCGFNSVSAFLRMFHILKGCTPTEFRKMQQVFPSGPSKN